MGHLEKGSSSTWGMSGQDIYLNFTSTAEGTAKMDAGAQQLTEISTQQHEDFDEFQKLSVKLESAWQGEAADAANRGLTPFAIEHQSSADALALASGMMNDQSGAFTNTKNGVVPVPPTPDKPAAMTILTDPAAMVTYQQQAANSDTASKHNVSMMQAYESTSNHNSTNLPTAYGQMTPDTTSVTVEPATAASGSGSQHREAPTGSGSGRAPTPPATSTKPPGQQVIGSSGAVTHPGSAPADPSGVRTGTPANEPGMPQPTPGRGSFGGELAPVPGGTGTGNPDAGSGSRGATSGRVAGGGGPVAGRPGSGGAAEPVGGPRTGRGMSASLAATEAEAVASRGGGRGGAIGGMPMGAGAGRGRGEDDERERPGFLLEPEPEDIFGTDEVTAPPVIE